MKRTDFQINLGLNLLRLRKESQLSQAEVAKGASIGLRTYSGIELSKDLPSLTTLFTLAAFFKVHPSELLK